MKYELKTDEIRYLNGVRRTESELIIPEVKEGIYKLPSYNIQFEEDYNNTLIQSLIDTNKEQIIINYFNIVDCNENIVKITFDEIDEEEKNSNRYKNCSWFKMWKNFKEKVYGIDNETRIYPLTYRRLNEEPIEFNIEARTLEEAIEIILPELQKKYSDITIKGLKRAAGILDKPETELHLYQK